jgi:hypothetical protein
MFGFVFVGLAWQSRNGLGFSVVKLNDLLLHGAVVCDRVNVVEDVRENTIEMFGRYRDFLSTTFICYVVYLWLCQNFMAMR